MVASRSSRWSPPALLALLALLILPAAAQATDRAFAKRFSATDTGDLALIGNTSMTCPASEATCAAAQAGAGSASQNNNNAHAMEYVDVDSDPSTFSSSRADLSLPPGATVLFAGLYWGGYSADSQRAAVKLDTPAPGGYVDLTASTLDAATIDANTYQGFADVTALVGAGGSGSYGVANVRGIPGTINSFAGWSLVVAYRDAATLRRSLVVWDGFQSVSTRKPRVAVPLSGLTTPTSRPVGASVGVVAYDGDRGLVGDSVKLNGTALSDGSNPIDNVFNSSITRRGITLGARQPNYVNQLGFDADVLPADAILAPGSTSATLELTTGNENYHPGVLTLAVDSEHESDPTFTGDRSIPGNLAAPSSCQLLRGAPTKRVRLPGLGKFQVRVRANGLVTTSEPAFATVVGPTGLRTVRYVLDGRKVKTSRRSPFRLSLRPQELREDASHLLAVRLVPRRGRSRRVSLTLRSAPCRTIFVATQQPTRAGSRLTLRVDSLRSLGRIAFTVPNRMLPKRAAKTRAGKLRLRGAGGARRVYRLSFGRRKQGGALLRASGAPRVSLGRGKVTVTRLPSETGVVKLVLLTRSVTRPSALVAPGRSVRLRARVKAGDSQERLSLRLRASR